MTRGNKKKCINFTKGEEEKKNCFLGARGKNLNF